MLGLAAPTSTAPGLRPRPSPEEAQGGWTQGKSSRLGSLPWTEPVSAAFFSL